MGETETQQQAATETPPEDLEPDMLRQEDIANLNETFPRERLYMPEWRKSVCPANL